MPTLTTQQVRDKAIALALLPRNLAAQPFTRRGFGRWAFHNTAVREATLKAVLEVWDGCVSLHTEGMPEEAEDEALNRPGRFEVNHLKSLVNKWSKLYSEEPTRTFKYKGKRIAEDDEQFGSLFERYKQARVNEVLEEADKMLRLTANVVTRPWYDPDSDRLVIHLYSGEQVRVVENRNDPERPFATVLVGKRRELGDDGAEEIIDTAEVWTEPRADEPGEFIQVEAGTAIGEPLRTKRPPLAFGFDRIPTVRTGFYVNPVGVALAGLDRLIANDFTSQLGNVLLMQGFGVAEIHGASEGQQLVVGPGRVIEFPGNPERQEGVNFAQPNAPISDWVEVIEFFVNLIRDTYDIPRSFINVESDASGAAIVQANAPLAEIRKERAKVFRYIETQLLRAIVDVLIAHDESFPSNVDPEDFELSIRFGEPKVALSTRDQIEKDEFDIKHGITTPAEILMRERPDDFESVEQAEAFLATRRERRDVSTGTPIEDDEDPASQSAPNDDEDQNLDDEQEESI